MATQKRLARNNNTSVASLNNSKLSLLNQIDEETQIKQEKGVYPPVKIINLKYSKPDPKNIGSSLHSPKGSEVFSDRDKSINSSVSGKPPTI